MKTGSQKGLSLLEILIVISIGLVLIALTAPLVATSLNMYRLRGAGGDYANLLQIARMRAITDDRYYNVVNTIGPLQVGSSMNAFVNTGTRNTGGPVPAQTYVAGDPGISFNPAVVIRPKGAAPNTVALEARFLPGIPAGTVVFNPNAWGPTFGARGLPCQAAAPTGATCSYTSGPAAQPIAFEVFLQNTRNGVWEAVTVNPSGSRTPVAWLGQ